MRFSQIYAAQEPALSLEFFPPRSADRLPETRQMISSLACFRPAFMTVTYGAAGGTRVLSTELVKFIASDLGCTAVQHLTCIAHAAAEIDRMISSLLGDGITHVLALRGDRPQTGTSSVADDFSCARDLVRYLQRHPQLSIAVAGYPETHRDASSPEADLHYLREKVEAGAEAIVTQLFFDPELYFRFVDRARESGINCPIVPGVMPISSSSQVRKFTSLCGATVPPAIATRLDQLEDDPDAITEYGIELATAHCRTLLVGGAPGIHFYTLNRSVQIDPILHALGWGNDSTGKKDR